MIKDITEAPNLQVLKDKFGISEEDTLISYGDTIYSPGKQMTHDLLVHELVHCQRQGKRAERWWELYVENDDFRRQEETLAYREQYLYCCRVYKDRNRRYRILNALAKEFSSSRYGNIITHSEAMKVINT
jgi:hypothetical protein